MDLRESARKFVFVVVVGVLGAAASPGCSTASQGLEPGARAKGGAAGASATGSSGQGGGSNPPSPPGAGTPDGGETGGRAGGTTGSGGAGAGGGGPVPDASLGGSGGSSKGGSAGSGGGSAPEAGTRDAANGGGAGGNGTGGVAGKTVSDSGGATGGGGAAGGSGGSTSIDAGADAAQPPGVSTDPDLKVAFIGDTDTGSTYTSVLNLIKAEGATAVVVEGDMSYSANSAAWWTATEAVLGTSFPVFISRGNHDDSSWSSYLPKAAAHLDGATRVAGAHDANYKTTWKGLVIATIKLGDTAANIEPFLANEPHIWKICQWHQNQAAMQIGGKTDEMGWEVYEACRKLGAIVQTGHEHSYERTKTLLDITSQLVDSTCAGVGDLCVGPGRTFVNVVGLGGQSVRAQLRCLPAMPPYGCNNEWAFIYTSNQGAAVGAQFITFNAGDPRKAVGYFKDVNGQTVDTFTITYDP